MENAKEEPVEQVEEPVEILDEDSTAPTTNEIPRKSNKYELFEKLLSFLDTTEELNPVLCGYFCKVFSVLVGNKSKEVYAYVYTHPEVLDLLVRHSY